jgi:hypothetical protein
MKLGTGPELKKIWKQRNNHPNKPMSKQINDGGPAFACDSTNKQVPTQEGMSLRAYFAGQICAGISASLSDAEILQAFARTADQRNITTPKLAAMLAVGYADALIAELGKEQA